jgi:hypothetical protein
MYEKADRRTSTTPGYVTRFDEIRNDAVALAGAKGANLARPVPALRKGRRVYRTRRDPLGGRAVVPRPKAAAGLLLDAGRRDLSCGISGCVIRV